MLIVQLKTHQRNYYQDDIVFFQKDSSDINIGDIVEIYSIDDKFSRLLLQISKIEKLKANASSQVSIEQSIALTFQLRNYNDVCINVVDRKTVLLDSVELFFKDQYLTRSDMWRLKKQITNTCVYLNKKIEFSNIRCQVFEMWSQGCRMASGYVNEETKVVFRSASSMVYLFIQMSSEMWDYDINGDLYFEKAVKGFLSDLFNKWKKFNCSHDVTIVLFSRTFYQASDINEFPESMRECLQQDYKGRFYEDYYRVAVQNERFDDWTPILIYLRKLFNLYEEEVIHYHKGKGLKAFNSTASQGNFLEVLNMSLNVFERHNIDRSFDRTGQLSVVISPGVGVYEVDLDLTNITKQRIIDNGIGSDLVCLGEQPLHAVPLFKFISKHATTTNDQYNMPHWINLSFYSSKQRFPISNFIPRIKMPKIASIELEKPIDSKEKNLRLPSFINHHSNHKSLNDSSPNGIDLTSCQNIEFIDYDEYDNQIFQTSLSSKHSQQLAQTKKFISSYVTSDDLFDSVEHKPKRRLSVVVPSRSINSKISFTRSAQNYDAVDGLTINPKQVSLFSLSTSVENKPINENHLKIKSKDDIVVHKSRGQLHKTKALINPFDPSHVTIKLNSNRRRWTHVFPLGPTGIFMQQHHYQAIPQKKSNSEDFNIVYDSNELLSKDKNSIGPNFKRTSFDQIDGLIKADKDKKAIKSRQNLEMDRKSTMNETDSYLKQRNVLLTDNSLLWAWGATGEQEWTPAITTGVDWKSLVMPACLPITTDFLPDQRTLQQDYVTYVYDLLPEEQANEFYQQKLIKSPEDNNKKPSILTNDQFYNELINQRLQQGFQIILLPKTEMRSTSNDRTEYKCTYILSIGRIYHQLTHKENKISIIYYHPRHQYKANNMRYCYRIRTPDNETYGVSWVDFTSEKLENYKWNYLDNYICLKGDYTEYPLIENLKYWRFRLLVLPTQQSKTKKIIDKYVSGEDDFQCDLYDVFSMEEKLHLQKGFIKLLKVMNGVKLPLSKQPTHKSDTKSSLFRRNSSITINTQGSDTILATINETNKNKSDNVAKPLATSNNQTIDSDTIFNYDLDIDAKSCSSQSSSKDVIELMKQHSQLFTIKFRNLPEYTFISLEAIEWAMKNIHHVHDEMVAENMFNDFLNNDLICHASGDKSLKPFKRGFYLYCILTENNQKFFQKNDFERKYFERAWMEVAIVQQHQQIMAMENTHEIENLLSNQCSLQTSEFTFKNFTVELDNKTDRVEWINVKYHSIYDPEQAFEMIIEWMVATGNAIPEIVSTWGRTKGTNLHIVPIPWDPFALPFSNRSDPLRGPVYISLNVDCLDSSKILEGERLFNFQEKILVKFGFIPFHDPSTDNQRQFVHVSGSIFTMIPSKNAVCSPKNLNKRGKFLKTDEQEMACSPHEEYITRHFSGVQQKQKDHEAHIDTKIGFLWCWNYMITKRWKTQVTGDENSMRKIMQDFRGFCSNKDDRLREFFKSYQTKIIADDDDDDGGVGGEKFGGDGEMKR